MHKAFFLDRDGTLNVDYDFVHKPEEWTWCEGAIDALRWMKEANYKIIVATNQSGISRERYTENDVQRLHKWVDQQLKKEGLNIDDWYYAPHHPEYDLGQKYDTSDRKPGTGMFLKAARKHNIDFSKSYMAGDKITDLKPALKLGITPLFIRSRHEPDQDKNWLRRQGIPIFDSLRQAIDMLKQR